MKKQLNIKTNFLTSVVLILLAITLAVTATLAWFISFGSVTDLNFDTGKLVANLELQYWNEDIVGTNKWDNVPLNSLSGDFYPYFGGWEDMKTPPEKSVYLKMRVDDNSGAKYVYEIKFDDIAINIYNKDNVKVTDNAQINAIDYYSTTLPQQCINSFLVVSKVDNLVPSEISFGTTATQITAKNQSVTAGDFVTSDSWCYVKLSLRAEELTNVARHIKVSYMPYKMEIVLSLSGEVRTVDNE